MEQQWHVIVYGRTVILGTVEASLRRYPQVKISVLSAPFPTVEELDAMTPDTILFDVAAPRPESALRLLETRPGLLLIGVDPSSDGALVLSSRPAEALSADDLVNVICQIAPQREEANESDESTKQCTEEDLHHAAPAPRSRGRCQASLMGHKHRRGD